MKLEVTNKEIRANYNTVIAIGYCKAYNLLYALEAFGKNTGVYGWNYDAYDCKGVCICTGYRNCPRTVSYDYRLLNRLEQKAKEDPINSSKYLEEFIMSFSRL